MHVRGLLLHEISSEQLLVMAVEALNRLVFGFMPISHSRYPSLDSTDAGTCLYDDDRSRRSSR